MKKCLIVLAVIWLSCGKWVYGQANELKIGSVEALAAIEKLLCLVDASLGQITEHWVKGALPPSFERLPEYVEEVTIESLRQHIDRTKKALYNSANQIRRYNQPKLEQLKRCVTIINLLLNSCVGEDVEWMAGVDDGDELHECEKRQRAMQGGWFTLFKDMFYV